MNWLDMICISVIVYVFQTCERRQKTHPVLMSRKTGRESGLKAMYCMA